MRAGVKILRLWNRKKPRDGSAGGGGLPGRLVPVAPALVVRLPGGEIVLPAREGESCLHVIMHLPGAGKGGGCLLAPSRFFRA